MNCTGMGNKPKPLLANPKKELIGNDMVKAELKKDVNKLQSDLDKHNKTFPQMRSKATGMIKDNTMAVTKEMVQTYRQVEDDILNHMKYISEVILLATLWTPMTLTPPPTQPRPPMPRSATAFSDLRVMDVRLMRKWFCFTTTAFTTCAVVHVVVPPWEPEPGKTC